MNVLLSILISFTLYNTAIPVDSASTQNSLTIMAEHKKAKAGEIVCVNVSVADFRSLLSMQYSINWDKDVLALEGVQGFNLPFLSVRNFGQHKKAEGILTFVWIDNDLKGVNLADGTAIYQLCFRVIGKRGSGSEIKFSKEPTPFEVVDVKEQILPLNPISGSVVIQ